MSASESRILGRMRLTEFHQLIEDEFGSAQGEWIVHSHVISALGGTAEELIEGGMDPRRAWLGLCDDFDVPEERRLGVDRPGEEPDEPPLRFW
ncbi:Protein of uncharacterised function (DUF3046) [Corynebacterium pilosum]|uniref:Protein of uncharacterized function (DUF3046) n=2 Tax=Corynebacterium pilosum TaxID=35756 RepID=A0A376CI38_9CORY|nr:Protein of uncharacterised function (DUF3046) [Corynebacterium pilosum]